MLLLTETSEQQAKAAEKKIRKTIESLPLMHSGETIRLTVSGGIAEYGAHGDSLQTLIRQADKCLYMLNRRAEIRLSMLRMCLAPHSPIRRRRA